MNTTLKKILTLMLPIAATMATPSCSDDPDMGGSSRNIIYDEPANVAFKLYVGDMKKVSRADMAEGKDSEIKDIWLALYDKRTGKRRYAFKWPAYFGDEETPDQIGTLDVDNGTVIPKDEDGRQISINSGEYYIAAVANATSYEGFLLPDGYSAETDPVDNRPLIDVLDDCLTFDQYKNVVTRRGNGQFGVIDTPSGELLMQGVFIPDGSNLHSGQPVTSDQAADYANRPVTIKPSTTTKPLDGMIHFRRLISQVKFNITYNTTNIKNFKIIDAHVEDLPTYSWLAERADAANVLDDGTQRVNAGDRVSFSSGSKSPFATSPVILPVNMGRITNGYSIDWYQYECRRVAVPYSGNTIQRYAQREEQVNFETNNMGVYKYLNGNTGSNFTKQPNSYATMLVVRAQLEMNPEKVDNPFTNDDGSEMKDENGDDFVFNSVVAEVTYSIHLGYCEGASEAEKAADFKTRRNTKYTYNVKIENVNKIVVEAKKENSDQYEHGQEGNVTFLSDEFFDLDAHYHVCNISLSDKERKNANWQIRYYQDPTTYRDITLVPEDYDPSTVYTEFAPFRYQWVELVPTSDADVIAKYNSSGKFYLTDIRNTAAYPHFDYNKNDSEDEQHWYTMYIKENYEGNISDSYWKEGGNRISKQLTWKNFVNLPSRQLWIRVQEFRSTDHESVVIRSKYSARQKSIQTYYATDNDAITTALGMEHINEIEGVTLDYNGNTQAKTTNDGRYMTWQAVQKNAEYLNDKFLKVNNKNTYLPNPTSSNSTTMSSIESARGCLNRNRDTNGNGIIEESEMVWYLPTSSQYVEIVMGAQGLSTPLYDFSDKTPESKGEYYHYWGSDNMRLWAEEGMSTGPATGIESQFPRFPTHIRCVRNLGTNDASITQQSPVTSAYENRGDKKIIDINFTPGLLRGEKYTGNRMLPVHYVNSEYNRTYSAFEYQASTQQISNWINSYKDDIDIPLADSYSQANYWSTISHLNICEQYNNDDSKGGWRLPNQAELAMMQILGVVNFNAGNYTVSCTQMFYGADQRTMSVTRYVITAQPVNQNSNYICVRDVEHK